MLKADKHYWWLGDWQTDEQRRQLTSNFVNFAVMILPCVIFGWPFVKRFALCYRTVVCLSCPILSCLSVCNVGVLWSNGLTDQDETFHAGRTRPWPHCVRWGPRLLTLPKGAQPPIFGPYPLRPNGCIDQDATWYGGMPRPRRLCVRWGPSSHQKRGTAPNFRPMSIVAKRLDGLRCYLVWRYASAQATLWTLC